MARVNKTQFSLLGCLSIKPMSAYDVKQFMMKSTQYFWMEHEAQLYPTLKKMLAAKLVTAKKETAQKGTMRVVYTITEKGLEVLQQWLVKESEPVSYRNEFLLKLFFGNQIPKSTVIKQIKAYREKTKADLDYFNQIEIKAENKPVKRTPFILATIKYGMCILDAEIKWCDETIQQLERK